MLFTIYAICFGVGMLFTLVSVILSHVFDFDHGVGSDVGADIGADVGAGGHVEAGFSHADVAGFAPVGPTTISAFITGFGGFGMVFSSIEATKSAWLSAPLSILCGFASAALVFWIFHSVFKNVQSTSEANIGSLVGSEAVVITPIPEGGVGEISYVNKGSRYNAPARCDSGVQIGAGTRVRIKGVSANIFFVEELK